MRIREEETLQYNINKKWTFFLQLLRISLLHTSRSSLFLQFAPFLFPIFQIVFGIRLVIVYCTSIVGCFTLLLAYQTDEYKKKRIKISRRNDFHSFRSYYGTLYLNIGEVNSDEEDVVDIRVTRLLLIKFDVEKTLLGGEYVGIVRKTLLVKTPSINYLFSSCYCVSSANSREKWHLSTYSLLWHTLIQVPFSAGFHIAKACLRLKLMAVGKTGVRTDTVFQILNPRTKVIQV